MATFVRLLGWLRPYRRGVVLSGLLAAVAMVMTVAIPWLTGRAIDRIQAGDKQGLTTLGLVILAAGVLRLALTVARRLVAGRVSLGVELDLRNRMYGHLQALELGFFDRQQTGQLMSRATVDLQAVRFFLGYGLVFILQSALTILLAGAAMFVVQPGLAAVSLIPVPIVVFVSARYGRRSRPALQELQQRIAELTADVEENIGGVRVVKAFAREDRQLERFRGRVGRVWDQAMVSTRMQAFYNPFIGFLPQLGLAAILFFGGRQVIDGRLTDRRVQRLLRLPAHAAVADAHARAPCSACPAGDRGRRPRLPDPRPRAADRLGARTRRRCRPARATWSCAACRCNTRAPSRPVLHDVDLDVARRDAPSPSSAPPARARRRSCSSSRACTTSPPARCSSTAPTCATSTSPRCAPRSPSSTTTPSCSAPPWPRTSPTRAPTRRRRRSSSRRAARRPTTSSRACPRATTRASASAG